MVCRDEHFEGAGRFIVRQNLRLERIALVWEERCTLKHNAWVDEYNRRVAEMNAQRNAFDTVKVKVNHWRHELRDVYNELEALLDRCNSGENIGPEHWDAIATGKEFKVMAIVGPSHPKATWPRSVPYPNLIAKAFYDAEEIMRRWRYQDRYHSIVKEIAERGQEIMDLKRLAGDTTDGVSWGTPKTLNQLDQLREQLRAEKQVQADGVNFEKNLYQCVATALQGERVLSAEWDAKSWANQFFTSWGLPQSDEAMGRLLQVMEDVVERWHLDNGHDAGDDDAVSLDSTSFSGDHLPHNVSNIDDGCLGELDEESVVDFEEDLSLEADFFLPYDV